MPLEPMKLAWLLTMQEAVTKALPDLKPSAVRLILAHAALESGWGTAKAYRHGFNFGNITAGPSWTGAHWTDIGGDVNAKGEPITQEWRAYKTLDDAIKDYWSFLGPTQNKGRYVKARQYLENANAIEFAIALAKAGYYELQPAEYLRRLGGVLAIVSKELAP